MQDKHELIGGEPLRAVEHHVFQVVGGSPLIGELLDRPGSHCQAQLGAPAGCLVLPDVVGESVVEDADADRLVGFNLHRVVGESRDLRL